MNMFDTFYQRFLLFADYYIIVGFKLGEQVFDDTGVDPVDGGGNTYGRSVSDDIHENRIESRRGHDDKVIGYLYGELGPDTTVS